MDQRRSYQPWINLFLSRGKCIKVGMKKISKIICDCNWPVTILTSFLRENWLFRKLFHVLDQISGVTVFYPRWYMHPGYSRKMDRENCQSWGYKILNVRVKLEAGIWEFYPLACPRPSCPFFPREHPVCIPPFDRKLRH